MTPRPAADSWKAAGGFLELSGKAKGIVRNGSVKLRVVRSGMYQQLTFTVRKVSLGGISYLELYTDRTVDTAEIIRVAEEVGLPVEAQNCKAFPKGTSASDFQNL
jgi:hypothetical protein